MYIYPHPLTPELMVIFTKWADTVLWCEILEMTDSLLFMKKKSQSTMRGGEGERGGTADYKFISLSVPLLLSFNTLNMLIWLCAWEKKTCFMFILVHVFIFSYIIHLSEYKDRKWSWIDNTDCTDAACLYSGGTESRCSPLLFSEHWVHLIFTAGNRILHQLKTIWNYWNSYSA